MLPLWWPLDRDRCACGKEGCSSPGKHPHGRLAPHGLDDATTDAETVERWWTDVPELNVGLRTGIVFDVLDLDRPGAPGDGSLSTPQRSARTPTTAGAGVRSPSPRTAHTCCTPRPVPATARDSPGSPGSTGAARTGTSWRRRHDTTRATSTPGTTDCGPDAPLPPAPEFLAALARKERPTALPAAAPSSAAQWLHANSRSAGAWSAAGLIGTMAVAVEGERNETLAWAAHRIGYDVHECKATASEADDALGQLHVVAERAGLGEKEIERTIASCFTAGLGGARPKPKAAS